MANSGVHMPDRVRLASTITPMPRDARTRWRARSTEAAAVIASVLGLALAIVNYAL